MAIKKKIKSFEETSKDIECLTGSKRERAENLLNKAQFMEQELIKLQNILSEKGWVEEYSNGATQKGLKKSSEADVYISLSKNYMAALKQLEDMIPDDSVAADELMTFIKR